MRVLLVEDDAMLGEGVRRGLRQLGYAIDWIRDGEAAELALSGEPYDVVLLDLGLPGKGGVEVLRDLRRRGQRVPVVILTAQDAIAQRVAGLDAGADDYVVKPFDLDELAARVRAVQRRSSGRAEPLLEHGPLTLNPATHEVFLAGAPVQLSAREFALLHALLEHPGRPVSRARLEERLYGWEEQVESNAVEVHVHALRRKLGAEWIKTLRGVGYMVPRRRWRSLRRTLLVTLLAAIAAVTLAASFLVYRLARKEIDQIFDYNLRQVALTAGDRAPGRGLVAGAREGFDFVIQIWDLDGTRLYLSDPETTLPENAELGFATVRTPTGDWRVFSRELSGLVIQVAQPLRVRQELAVAAALRTLAPVLLLLPLLALVVWQLVGRALAPLDELAREVGARTPLALEPIAEAGTPDEVVPLVHALNALLDRLGTALVAQRAFVADAAHELRTPLAALELQLRLVERAPDPAERASALAALRAGLARMTHVVEQLLTLARAEPDAAAALAGEPVSLPELAAQVIADHALLAEAKRIDLGAARAGDGAIVEGDPASLRTLLANLVDNALRHSPSGGRVDVDAGVLSGRPYLEVSDHGPGVPESDRERVFDRFYRRGGSETGSGLGLAIVKAIARRHAATVSLRDTPGGGLTVRVQFPARTVEVAPPGTPNEDARP